MSRRGPRWGRTDPRVAAARVAAGFAVLGAGTTTLAAMTMLEGPSRCWTLVVSGVLLVFAALLVALPWERWSASALFVVVPLTCAITGFGNWASPNPYDAFVFFILLAVWIGASQRRGTVVASLPFILPAFWWPLHLAARDDVERHLLVSSLGYFALIVLVLGEGTAWIVARIRRMNARLREHDERRFARLVENASDLTLLVGADGVVTYASPSVRAVLGREPGDLVGARIEDIAGRDVHPEDLAHAISRLHAVVAEGAATATVELRLQRSDGG